MASHTYRLLFAALFMTAAASAAEPAAPLGVAMVANTVDSVTLAWYRSPTGDATSWRVYACDKKDGEFALVATVTERTATHSGLKAGTERFYKVSAVNDQGEGPRSTAAPGFTIVPCEKTPFPVKVAKNMCASLKGTIVSTPAPAEGKLTNLVDGLDATSCAINGECDVRIKLNADVPIADAEYLMLNFRTDVTGKDYAYNINWRSLKKYTITESLDSTDGKDGTWKEIANGTNEYLDGVIVLPNHKPKWIGIHNSGSLQLCRLDVFRSAPKGERNDYWIFTGDSLIVQDLMGGSPERHTVWFSDLVREKHPDRYPMVVNSSQGGEVMANTIGRMKKYLPVVAGPNGSDTPTGTILCFEPGFNDVGVGGGLWMGPKINKALLEAQDVCKEHGVVMVPVRIEYATTYLDPQTLEPTKYNVFYNTLPVNLAGVDVFARANTPYACDPATQLPYADYWTYTRKNHATALGKDGVHHTKAGSDGINRLWADVADRMIYSPQSAK